MPDEVDEVGAPDLCDHHRAVANNAHRFERLEHAIARNLQLIARQCCTRRTP